MVSVGAELADPWKNSYFAARGSGDALNMLKDLARHNAHFGCGLTDGKIAAAPP